MSMDTTPTPDAPASASPVAAAHQRMSDWFDTVSYVGETPGVVPEVDDPEDDQD